MIILHCFGNLNVGGAETLIINTLKKLKGLKIKILNLNF